MRNIRKHVLLICFLLAIAVLATPFTVRMLQYDGLPVGEESYWNMRIARDISRNIDVQQDNLIYEYRPIVPDPFQILLGILSYVSGDTAAAFGLPIFLGLISVFLLYRICRELELKSDMILGVVSIYILSPSFIWLFLTANKYSLYTVLLLLTAYLFVRNLGWIAILPALLLPMFGFLEGAVALMLLTAIFYHFRKSQAEYIVIAFVLVVITSVREILVSAIPKETPRFLEYNYLGELVSSLGAQGGISIFALLLAITGVIFLRRKQGMIAFYLGYILLFVGFAFRPELFIHLIALASSFFAGYAIIVLIERKWEVDYLKTISVAILICGILFSCLAYINRMPYSQPTLETRDVLISMEPGGLVISDFRMGNYIQYFAGRQVFLDSQLDSINNVNSKYNETMTLFLTQTLKQTKEVISTFGIETIVITQDMKDTIWEDEQGLLFYLANNETFNKTFQGEDIEVWQVLS